MNTKFFTSIVTIFFLLCSSTASICLGKEYITEEDIWTCLLYTSYSVQQERRN